MDPLLIALGGVSVIAGTNIYSGVGDDPNMKQMANGLFFLGWFLVALGVGGFSLGPAAIMAFVGALSLVSGALMVRGGLNEGLALFGLGWATMTLAFLLQSSRPLFVLGGVAAVVSAAAWNLLSQEKRAAVLPAQVASIFGWALLVFSAK